MEDMVKVPGGGLGDDRVRKMSNLLFDLD